MRAVRSSCLFTLLIALFATQLFESPRAQSPPRPNVAIAKLPALQVNIWPADLNEDGVTDLVGSAGPFNNPDLVVGLGRGDGTFEDPLRVGAAMAPVTVGDFNADANLDIVATVTDDGFEFQLFVLAGHGDGTFAPPLPIGGRDVTGLVPNGMTADFNADGHRDLAVMAALDDSGVHIYHGNGDLTFAPAITLATSPLARQFIVSDLNGDSRPDVVVATECCRAFDLFLNSGTGFTYSQIPFPRPALGITVADMDRDGTRDLVVSSGDKDSFQSFVFITGFVDILRGRGDGTFDAPVSFATNAGPALAVVGDYNGDGLTDVATGNLSIGWNGRCEEVAEQWDSVSILPGLGNGALGAAATFALDNAQITSLYRSSHTALKTSDLNADGRTDLIATRGAILLGAPSATNRPPAANAGPDQDNVIISPDFRLRGSATDPDSDWLTWEWTDQAGNLLGTHPTACVFDRYQGTQTFTLTVRDGRGGVATDSVTYRFQGSLPVGWGSQDIGDAGGFSHYDGARYTVNAAGADVWGTTDEFHYVQTGISGDFEFTAYVPYVENVDGWTKAGVMIRDGLAANARHAFLFATPRTEHGVAFQRRPVAGGTSVHTSGPAVAPPVRLRLTRRGDVVTAAVRVAGATAWTPVGEQRFTGLPDFVNVGLALTSHVKFRRAQAWFEQVTLVSLESHVPTGWTATDVGAVGAEGRSSVDEDSGPEYTVTGSGADVWGTADEFHFLSREITGDFDFSARVAQVNDVDQWTKAGLMLRDGLAAGARHAFVIQTPRSHRGVAYQRRPVASGATVHTPGPANAPPGFLRLVREGNVVSAYYRSEPAGSWALVGTQTFTALAATVRIGFAVTSHVDGMLATGQFDNVRIEQSGWQSSDIGAVSAEGSSVIDEDSGPEFIVRGSGADVWDTSDELHFLSRAVTGDFDFSGRAAVVEDIDRWTKAGLMMRDGVAANARHAFVIQTPRADRGVAFQRRPTTGGASLHTAGPANAPPGFLRLVRTGDAISAYYRFAPTGTWTLIGTQTFTALPATVRIGFAVSSHVDGTLASAAFDNFVLTQ